MLGAKSVAVGSQGQTCHLGRWQVNGFGWWHTVRRSLFVQRVNWVVLRTLARCVRQAARRAIIDLAVER